MVIVEEEREVGVMVKVPPLVRSCKVTAAPETKLEPLIVSVCCPADPGTGLGDTEEIDGVVTVVAWTWNWKELERTLPGLTICTDHVAVALVKLALMVIVKGVRELGVLVKMPPLVRSRKVTEAPETKFEPLIVRVCCPADPGTGLGDTEEIEGVVPAVTCT